MDTVETIQSPATLAEKPELKRPPMYQVILLNDDFTPMDFVVDVLCRFFQKSVNDATTIMLDIHHKGKGLCGIYPHGIAESKIARVNHYSRTHAHPLRCLMERHDA